MSRSVRKTEGKGFGMRHSETGWASDYLWEVKSDCFCITSVFFLPPSFTSLSVTSISTRKFFCFCSSYSLPHPTGWGNEQAAVWCLAADLSQLTTMGEKKKKQQKKGCAETYFLFWAPFILMCKIKCTLGQEYCLLNHIVQFTQWNRKVRYYRCFSVTAASSFRWDLHLPTKQ